MTKIAVFAFHNVAILWMFPLSWYSKNGILNQEMSVMLASRTSKGMLDVGALCGYAIKKQGVPSNQSRVLRI